MEKLKYIRIQQGDDKYYGDIPIGVDSENVDLQNGYNLQQTLGSYDYTKYGTIKEKFDNIQIDINDKINNINTELNDFYLKYSIKNTAKDIEV